MKPTRFFLLSFASFALAAAGSPAIARAWEKTGTIGEDGSNLVGMFNLENDTNRTIRFQIDYGDGQPKHFKLPPHSGRKFEFPLDSNFRAPNPTISFYGGPQNHTLIRRALPYNLVGYPGYGPGSYLTVPTDYGFDYSYSGSLDLFTIRGR
jgi:hypothetical protein